MDFKLEVCVDSIESALTAQSAGADRVELCTNLPEGGTTPSAGLINSVRNNLTIGLHVLIRPRGGDFLYSDAEFDIMRRDIEFCGENGVDGVVLGILLPDGSIDIERTSRLIELARPMVTTFHRAFDLSHDPFKCLEDIITCGADKILTSGQKNKADEGLDLISKLVLKSNGKITIMPGSGININNIENIARISGATEFHMTGRKSIDSDMIFQKNDVYMGNLPEKNEYKRKVADKDIITEVINILNLL